MENEKNSSFLGISILVAALLISGSIIYVTLGKDKGNDSGGQLAQVAAQQKDKPTQKALIDDDVVLGDPNAPVTIVIFGDFQCPYCKRLFDQTEWQIKDNYVATGKVKLVSRDLPLDAIHPYARSAAENTECARDQGKYWAFRDTLFERQAQIPSIDYSALAKELGLNVQQFDACVASEKYVDEVEKDYKDAAALGITGTPATFVNGVQISGAQPYAVFQQAIEAALAEAK